LPGGFYQKEKCYRKKVINIDQVILAHHLFQIQTSMELKIRRLLVTGGAGFIGSHFIKKSLKQGFEILNFDALTYAANPNNLCEIQNHSNYTFIKGNVCNLDKLQGALSEFAPDAVIHFAAETHVDNSITKPAEFIKTNIEGTSILLQVALDYWQNLEDTQNFKFIHVSTDEVFGSLLDKGHFTETTPYSPNSPYSASKASSDLLVKAWNKTYDFPSIITNCSNNFGTHQYPEKLIPKTIHSILEGQDIKVYGKGKNIRDWLHVNDHVDALLLLLRKGKIGEQYLIGGGTERTNIALVHEICEIIDRIIPTKNESKKLIRFVPDRLGHDYRYAIDPKKMKNELNWEPKIDFKVGLEQTIEWYLTNFEWWKNTKRHFQ